MDALEPCPSCRRHVAITEAACPFCASALPAHAARSVAAGRVTRAAVFAGATLLAAAGCGGKKPVVADQGSGSAMGSDTSPPVPDAGPTEVKGPDNDHAQPMPYGAPPARKRLV